jgi:hypothetical protein
MSLFSKILESGACTDDATDCLAILTDTAKDILDKHPDIIDKLKSIEVNWVRKEVVEDEDAFEKHAEYVNVPHVKIEFK